MEIGAETMNKAIEMVANVAKTTANLTETEKKGKREKNSWQNKGGDTNNQQHQQTVEVHVGEQKEQQKPMIIKEKPETHIHKHFPDNRALTKEECDLEQIRIKLDFEEKERERAFRREMNMIDRTDRKEREERERIERLRKEEEQKKRRKARNIAAGIIGTAMLGCLGYAFYTDFRDNQTRRNAALPEGSVLNVEGKVE